MISSPVDVVESLLDPQIRSIFASQASRSRWSLRSTTGLLLLTPPYPPASRRNRLDRTSVWKPCSTLDAERYSLTPPVPLRLSSRLDSTSLTISSTPWLNAADVSAEVTVYKTRIVKTCKHFPVNYLFVLSLAKLRELVFIAITLAPVSTRIHNKLFVKM
ncbi:hypothetical protein OESDEN_24382 [Oesophagostomum dentatum]|uniref:Uncharacterized protein n=1 Tax=Oesophagostomum dentatum TaxID=61180 RepID=A0A0B1RTK6_OESDE|nr:hypothetical protein OESDEN_24382 [Oesophagostomum dentatum]